MTPALGAEIAIAARRSAGRAGLPRCLGSPATSAAGSGRRTGIRTISCGCTIAGSAAGTARRVHESVELSSGKRRAVCTTSCSTIPTATSPTTSTTHRSLHDARGRAVVRRRPPHQRARRRRSTRGSRSSATTSCAAASRTAPPACSCRSLNSYYVFLKLAKLWELQHRAPATRPPIANRRDVARAGIATATPTPIRAPDVLAAHRHGADLARRAEPGAGHGDGPARARASDDARRAPGRRAAAARARRARPDSARAEDRDGPERRLAPVAAAQAAQAGHRPRARSARRRDGGAGAVDEHAAVEAAARRLAPRRLPPARQLAVALEVPPGGLLHLRVGRDPQDARRRRRSRAAGGHRARGHRPRARRGGAAGEPARGAVAAARRADRRQRRRARAAQGAAASDRGRDARPPAGARRAVRDRRRGRAAADARAADQGASPREARACSPASAPTSCRCTRRSTSS